MFLFENFLKAVIFTYNGTCLILKYVIAISNICLTTFNLQLLNDVEQNPSEIKEFNKSEENIVLKTRLEQANQMIEKLQVVVVNSTSTV